MKNAQHTPEPWVNEGVTITAKGGRIEYSVDVMWGEVTNSEMKANARLITASPKLLRILLAILPEIDSEIEQRQHGGNDEDWAELKSLSDEAHAAVAEAAGGAL